MTDTFRELKHRSADGLHPGMGLFVAPGGCFGPRLLWIPDTNGPNCRPKKAQYNLRALMRILTVLTYYRPHTSGLTIYAERLARALTRRGHQVTVMTTQYDRRLPRREKMDGVDVRARAGGVPAEQGRHRADVRSGGHAAGVGT